MMEVGRLCVKIAGRDAGMSCLIVDILKDNFAKILGEMPIFYRPKIKYQK